MNEPESREGYKDSLGYGLWCLFLFGFAGIHRIYLGKYGTGILWLLTFGLLGIGQFIDLFRMRSLIAEANIRDGYLPHPRYAKELTGPRAAPEPSTTQRLLQAAGKYGGTLTVTQAVAETGLSFKEVEETLTEMLIAGYVDVDNEPTTGVVIYRFPELLSGSGRSAPG
ncbi:MAG: TM2 domain-containing protein [Gemmatimonadota bacterium]|jgi:TM2 domain-containing membrane protein YozV|nr:MAG: TM2 domain-containing protein [Gemmatimonadota bacterium]